MLLLLLLLTKFAQPEEQRSGNISNDSTAPCQSDPEIDNLLTLYGGARERG